MKLIDELPKKASVKEMNALVRNLTPEQETLLLKDCSQRLRERRYLIDEASRILLVKIVVAMLPKSMNMIRRTLADQFSRVSFEAHFTFFCYLDDIFDFSKDAKLAIAVLAMVKTYLVHASKNTGMAAWMAGDLIGEHWRDEKAALLGLLHVLKKSQHAAGKLAALHGIEHYMKKHGRQGNTKLRNELESAQRSEKHRGVRKGIAALLEGRA